MDPAIVFFGLGIGVLVGMTGMGGGSLMTPMLILIFGIQPTTAIGTDIFYSAVTKTVGGWRHLQMKTVNMGLTLWLAAGSVPASILGVWAISLLEKSVGEDRLDSIVYALLGGTLLMVGIITLARALIVTGLIEERDDFELKRRHKVAAVAIGATTGFVIVPRYVALLGAIRMQNTWNTMKAERTPKATLRDFAELMSELYAISSRGKPGHCRARRLRAPACHGRMWRLPWC